MDSFSLSTIKPHSHIHFIGIGGVSMNGIAEMMVKRGFIVSGSDREHSPITDHLKTLGVTIFIGQCGQNITDDISLVVYTGAIHADNPEMSAALSKNIRCIERPILLGAIMQEYDYDIAVSGTHGKTTVTSMISTILIHAKKDPSINVGGYLPIIDGTTKIGSSEYFIVEACEYRRSFLNFKPTVAVINNIEEDHMDFYKDIDDIISAFSDFAKGVKEGGCIVARKDDSHVEKALHDINKPVITFSLSKDADFYADSIVYDVNGGSQFTIMKKGEPFAHVKLSAPGSYNVLNALAAAAVCDFVKISSTQIAEGLSDFVGSARRFEKKATYHGCDLIDDYAHHPTEIECTIKAAISLHKKHVYAMMQPHTYSRLKALFDGFSTCLAGVDEVVVCDVYAAREAFDPTASPEKLAEAMRKNGINAVHMSDFEAIADYYKSKVGPDDILLSIGAGDVNKILDLF
jgi:UDP-N-acetylmuramate--alanine ligase